MVMPHRSHRSDEDEDTKEDEDGDESFTAVHRPATMAGFAFLGSTRRFSATAWASALPSS